ncbi:hypothetical protein CKY04_06760 [Photorhabdus sp. S8-52]|nr:hypothetical protein CKY03_06615 [Photorhabdus sp. S9-53]RAX01640.1 hypothetical protein CKY05_05855 [Photorhabdus sp. S10-54]RAX05055.1 hypothetical protein CKY04_06760 [Photorhabdus sp. S8-52]
MKRLNRKTLGYSKSVGMHDRVIGTISPSYIRWRY